MAACVHLVGVAHAAVAIPCRQSRPWLSLLAMLPVLHGAQATHSIAAKIGAWGDAADARRQSADHPCASDEDQYAVLLCPTAGIFPTRSGSNQAWATSGQRRSPRFMSLRQGLNGRPGRDSTGRTEPDSHRRASTKPGAVHTLSSLLNSAQPQRHPASVPTHQEDGEPAVRESACRVKAR